MSLSDLPPAIAQLLQQELSDDITVERFTGGHQHSWLLSTTTGRLVLRLNQQQACYGLNYQRERDVLQQLKGLPWVIDMHALSLKEDFLLYRYQSGDVLSAETFTAKGVWQQLLSILDTLPGLSENLAHLDMPHYLAHYVTHIQSPAAQDFKAQAQAWLSLQHWPSHKAFNHHDLHMNNVLLSPSQHICILDWEYAATSIQGWDAASVAVRFPINQQQRDDLVAISGLTQKMFTQLEAAVELLDLAWYWQYQVDFPHLRLRSQQWLSAHCR